MDMTLSEYLSNIIKTDKSRFFAILYIVMFSVYIAASTSHILSEFFISQYNASTIAGLNGAIRGLATLITVGMSLFLINVDDLVLHHWVLFYAYFGLVFSFPRPNRVVETF